MKGLWRTLVETGQVPAEELLANLRQTSRDHARTPMQWTAGPNGGFSTGRPWLAVNPNFTEINAASQVNDPDSVFAHHRALIALRKAHPALVHGAYRDIDPDHEQVFCYTRTLRGTTLLVIINMGRDPLDFQLPEGLTISATLLSTGAEHAAGAAGIRLEGWEAGIYDVTGVG